MKIRLLGKTPEELRAIAVSLGLPAYTGKQLASWLYKKAAPSISEMTDISKAGREKLEAACEVGREHYGSVQCSADGTKKYLFPVTCSLLGGLNRIEEGLGPEQTAPSVPVERGWIEAVMIPDEDRKTLCVSSQAGCRMGCRFCMTGRQGFHGHLSACDIINQFLSVDESGELTNAVFMGMGEPLDNYENVSRAIEVLTAEWGFGWSPKRITLSTIGVPQRLKRFLDESKCHLAVSLHDPFPEERWRIMPAQASYNIRDIVALIRKYDFSGQRRVSFEYTMFSGLNDSPRHADALLRLLKGLECRVNLIRFHKIPDFPYITAGDSSMEAFRDRLNRGGLTATIRASRGEDIAAACGMLAGKIKEGK